MNELLFNKDFDEIDWLKRVDGETILCGFLLSSWSENAKAAPRGME